MPVIINTGNKHSPSESIYRTITDNYIHDSVHALLQGVDLSTHMQPFFPSASSLGHQAVVPSLLLFISLTSVMFS